MAELMHFQPGKTFYDAFQGARGNTLAKLAITGEGEQRKSALADLYGLNPEMAQAAQGQIKANEAQDYADMIDGAKVMYAFKDNPEMASQAYSRFKPRLESKYGIKLPDTPDATVWNSVSQIVGAQQGALPSDVQSFDYFTQGMTAEEKDKARRIRLGLDQKVGAEGIKYLPNGGAAYEDPVSKKIYMINPGETTWREFSYPTAMGTQAPPKQRDWASGDKPQSLEEIQDWYRFWQGKGMPKEQLDKGADQLALSIEYTKDFRVDGQPSTPSPAPVQQTAPAITQTAPPPVTTGGQGAGWVDTSKPKDEKVETWGAPTAVTKNGKPAMIQISNLGNERERPDLAPAQSDGKLTDDMRKTSTLLSRMDFALKQIQEVERTNKSANRPGYGVAVADYLPESISNDMKSGDRQVVEAAQLDALDAALTLATGAAYTAEQLIGLRKSYFPQPNDDEATIKAKQARFENVIQSARVRAGNAAQTPAKPAGGANGAPKVGDVVKGYQYLGGNPADPKSWKKQ